MARRELGRAVWRTVRDLGRVVAATLRLELLLWRIRLVRWLT